MNNESQPDTLELFISTMLGDEAGSAILRANDALVETQYTDHLTAIENVLGMADDSHNEDTLDRVMDTMKHTLHYLITDYGITMSSWDMDLMVDVYKSLFAIEEQDNPRFYLDIINESDDPIETYSEILSALYGKDITKYMDAIDRVDSSLIDRMQVTLVTIDYSKQLQAEEDEEVNDILNINFYNWYIDNYNPKIIQRFISEGMKLGFEFNTYLNRALDEDIDNNSAVNPKELVGMWLASGNDLADLQHTASTYFEYITDDSMKLSRMMDELNNLLRDMMSKYNNTDGD